MKRWVVAVSWRKDMASTISYGNFSRHLFLTLTGWDWQHVIEMTDVSIAFCVLFSEEMSSLDSIPNLLLVCPLLKCLICLSMSLFDLWDFWKVWNVIMIHVFNVNRHYALNNTLQIYPSFWSLNNSPLLKGLWVGLSWKHIVIVDMAWLHPSPLLSRFSLRQASWVLLLYIWSPSAVASVRQHFFKR